MNEESVIEVEGLHRSFRGTPVLRGVDLTIRTGETMVILGRSGSGKSVLLKHLNALFVPERGRVRVLGEDVSDKSEAELGGLRRRVGILFQGGALFDSMTVADNVAFALDEHKICTGAEREGRVAALLDVVDLAGTQSKMPSELSGGMRKRAALARTLALEPEILLYDEPTTGLDPVTGYQINLLIRDLQRRFGLTSVVVTHDLASAYFVADRMAFLADGRIRKVATPDDMANENDEEIRVFLTSGELHHEANR